MIKVSRFVVGWSVPVVTLVFSKDANLPFFMAIELMNSLLDECKYPGLFLSLTNEKYDGLLGPAYLSRCLFCGITP